MSLFLNAFPFQKLGFPKRRLWIYFNLYVGTPKPLSTHAHHHLVMHLNWNQHLPTPGMLVFVVIFLGKFSDILIQILYFNALAVAVFSLSIFLSTLGRSCFAYIPVSDIWGLVKRRPYCFHFAWYHKNDTCSVQNNLAYGRPILNCSPSNCSHKALALWSQQDVCNENTILPQPNL